MYDFLNIFHMEADIPQNPGTDFDVVDSGLDDAQPNMDNPLNANPVLNGQTGVEIGSPVDSGYVNPLEDNYNSLIEHNNNNQIGSHIGFGSDYGSLVEHNNDGLVNHNYDDVITQDYGSLCNPSFGDALVSSYPAFNSQFSDSFGNNTSLYDPNIDANELTNKTVIHSPTGFYDENGEPGFGVSREEYEAQERKLDDLKSKLESAKSREEDKKDKVESCASNVKSALKRWENAPLDDSKIRYKNTLELNEKWYDDAVRSYKYAHEEVEKLSDQVASLSSTVRELKNKIDK